MAVSESRPGLVTTAAVSRASIDTLWIKPGPGCIYLDIRQLGHHITLVLLHVGQGEPVQDVARHVEHGPATSTHHHQPRLQQPQTVDTICIIGLPSPS